MRIIGSILAASLILAGAAHAATPDKALQPLAFLVGAWDAGKGEVAETGGTSRGMSRFTVEASGEALLRKDHTYLFNKAGKRTGGFDQIMLIYPEAGTLHADYVADGHVIHYGSATVVEGRSVEFTSITQSGAPTFKLRYELTAPDTLSVAFSMAPPGQAGFRPIATGALHRAH